MNLTEISLLRLTNQQIQGSQIHSAKEIVGWMGAMQAQDYIMAKWAIGVRFPGSSEKDVESDLDNGEILRTHILRPTWHFVSKDDIYWILDLTAGNIKSAMKSRDKELELSESLYAKSNSILGVALRDGIALTREDLAKLFENASIPTNENRLSHILMRAELDGIICSGPNRENKRTYALLSDRVKVKKTLPLDVALAKLAFSYFRSHCPATLHDFAWWSGLSMGDSRTGLEMIKSKLFSEIFDNKTYWLTEAVSVPPTEKDLVHTLPAYDEYLISYKDRSASLSLDSHINVVSNNGIFRPVILLNGRVIGIWKRVTAKNSIIIETVYFNSPEKKTRESVEGEFIHLERFLGKKVEIVQKLE
jgi:hypothetical protein